MIASIRRMSKSKIGTGIMAVVLVLILAGFALQDSKGVGGRLFGSSAGTLASVGSEEVTDREMSAAMQRRLNEVRQANPVADYAALSKDFDPLLTSLIQDAAVRAFATDQDMFLSKRLVDAEIAKIPATRGLDGKFSQQGYQAFLAQQKLSDGELRKLLSSALLQRLVLAPASANARLPVGMAGPYASMLLERREADIGSIPTAAFATAVGQPNDAQLAAFHRDNARRYTVPEQRVLSIARIGPAQVAGITATDKEISDYYNANQATYGGKAKRVISQAVVPTKQAADALVARARGGATFLEASKPLGLTAADISVGPQTLQEFTKLTSADVARAAFSAASGAIVGPIHSDLGWHVVKIDAIQNDTGRSLESVKGAIATELTAQKRKAALSDLVSKVEDSIAEGSSFAEAVKAAGLTSNTSPPVIANGTSSAQPGFKMPPELAPAVRAGFDLAEDDDPVVETLSGDAGYALVAAERIIAAAPASLASIRDRVMADWKSRQASDRARAVARQIEARLAKGMDLNAAIGSAGVKLPPSTRAVVQRLQLVQMGDKVPPALKLMFSLAPGKSRVIADPQGRGFTIVDLTRIIPGNAALQPSLVAQTQKEFQEPVSAEYAEQFNRAIQDELGAKRNEKAIAATRKRIIGGGG
ncbi:MAG: peptidylprolyl isomerase [Sphingomicrobium sp.]